MLTLDKILLVLGTLVGWPAAVALAIDVLKNFKVVTDDNAGKWNLGFQLAGFLIVAILLGFFPTVDIAGWDAILLNYVTIVGYVVMLLLQMFGAKLFHAGYKKLLGEKKVAISYSARYDADPDF
jgi:hypothetical protein